MKIEVCYKILKDIEHRPAMHTGENSLRAINIYISGYYRCLLDRNIINIPETSDPFFDWVANKLGYFESTAGWVNMINAVSLGYDTVEINWEDFLEEELTPEQNSKSINLFYEFIEEYIKNKK